MIIREHRLFVLALLAGCLFLLESCNKVHIKCTIANSEDCFQEVTSRDCGMFGPADFEVYDIFLIIGQSNSCSGKGLDPQLDGEHPRIKQLGRHGDYDLKVIPAIEPLDHYYRAPESIGFAMSFARAYVCDFLAEDRNVLLIPGALNNTGFIDRRWRAGDDLYQDAVFRTNKMLERYPGSKLKVILWHQGEKDVDNPEYTMLLDSMIRQIRRDIRQANAESIPFLLGGMVPHWVDQRRKRQRQECLIMETPGRVANTAFADPREPCVIRKEDNDFDKIHYDAAGQREFGMRYFEAYVKIK